ncbi:MAG: metal-dependent hydrolase, partial [Planctomycetota bacterium]
MDNLAHALAGAAMARALPERWAGGLKEADPAFDPDANRPGVWLTLSAVVAANLPDFEALILWPPPWGDKASYLLHHRGWSHSLIGVAAEAMAFGALLWGLAYLFQRVRPSGRLFAGYTPGRGFAVAGLGAGSHLFMDWWNGYGVRPFYPFDKSWYYGDLAFILDPWIWLTLGGAVVCGTRRFGRTKWVWYGLTALTTGIVVWACWNGRCPWWVTAAWATGVVEIVLLRLWGRWRFAPLIAAGLLCGYLGANA